MVSRKLKTWTAYRIKGVRSEPHHGLIYVWMKEQAYAIFGAKTDQERRRVYVRETNLQLHVTRARTSGAVVRDLDG